MGRCIFLVSKFRLELRKIFQILSDFVALAAGDFSLSFDLLIIARRIRPGQYPESEARRPASGGYRKTPPSATVFLKTP